MTSRIKHLCALLMASSMVAFSSSAAPALSASPAFLGQSDTPAGDSLLPAPRLAPFVPEMAFEVDPSRPVSGKLLRVTLTLGWEGDSPLLLRPIGWASISPLEPLDRSEFARREVKGGTVRNERVIELRYRPLREGEIDFSALALEVIRGAQVDTVGLPELRLNIAPRPILPLWGWIAMLFGIVGLGVLIRFHVVTQKRKKTELLREDPAVVEASRWRKLKSELKVSADRRAWLGEVHDLIRDRLIREGGASAARTDDLLAQKIASLSDENRLRPAWERVRQEVVHYLYGGGLRPLHRNRETLRALQLTLELDEEDLQ